MRKVWAVIRREFIERVRTRWFLVSTILGPLFMITAAVLPSLLAMKSGSVNRIELISGGADSLASRIRAQLIHSGRFDTAAMSRIVSVDEDLVARAESTALRQVTEGALDGYLVLTTATIEAGRADYRARNVSSLRDLGIIEGAVRQSVIVERLTRRGIDPAVVQEAQGRIDLRSGARVGIEDDGDAHAPGRGGNRRSQRGPHRTGSRILVRGDEDFERRTGPGRPGEHGRCDARRQAQNRSPDYTARRICRERIGMGHS